MIKLYLLSVLILVVNLTLTCFGQEKTVVKKITLITTENDPGPPPNSVINTKLITLKAWFFQVCDEDGNSKTNVSYKFEFWETGNSYQIGLIT